MITARYGTRTTRIRSIEHFFALYPEWWSVAFCGIAWSIMLHHRWQFIGQNAYHQMTFTVELQYWLLMVAAMMLPLILDVVRATAVGSLWTRRHRAIAGFLLGYFSPWLALGFVAAGLRHESPLYTSAAPALIFAIAALWQSTPMYRRAVNACHSRRPLAPVGWQADRDCLRYGGTISLAHVLSCWPLMLACAFAGHGLVAMAGGMAVGALEHWPYRPHVRTALTITLALAGCYVVLASLDWGFLPNWRSPIGSQ